MREFPPLEACKQQAKWRTGTPHAPPPSYGGGREGEGLSRCISQAKINDLRLSQSVFAALPLPASPLAIHDTSEINFRTSPEHRRGLGEIAKGNSYGVLLHAMLAVDAQSGDSLGLVSGEIWTRQGRQVIAHDKRAASERESRRWLSTALASKQVLSAASTVTVIGDRESDIYSAWAQFPEGKFHLLSRSMQDRALVGGGSLEATVAAFPVASPPHPRTGGA